MLQLTTIPDYGCLISPAKTIYRHKLQECFAFLNKLNKFSNPAVQVVFDNSMETKTRTAYKINKKIISAQ